MSTLSRRFMVALTGVVMLAGVAARQPSAQTTVQSPYTAWAATKHATALRKLSDENRQGGTCIKCHVTGSPEMIAAEGANPSFPNVQCEACHGAGRAHVDAAKTGDSVTDLPKKTTEETCVRCHNETSPHYKPFYYAALKGLVHRD
jgi:formate-dependent nitrite reductase cytochrome c552 subunit